MFVHTKVSDKLLDRQQTILNLRRKKTNNEKKQRHSWPCTRHKTFEAIRYRDRRIEEQSILYKPLDISKLNCPYILNCQTVIDAPIILINLDTVRHRLRHIDTHLALYTMLYNNTAKK